MDHLPRTIQLFFTFIFPATATAAAKLRQSCPTLRDPIDGSPPGSSVPGILQARTLEWIAMAFSRSDIQGLHGPQAENSWLNGLQTLKLFKI